MNRREFHQSLAGLAALHIFGDSQLSSAPSHSPSRFSVMLWTLDHKTPFDQCLEAVAAAGYQGVQLVNEYRAWSQQDTRRTRARMHSLGLICDTMSGIKTGFADPRATSTLLEEFNALIPIAQELECPQIILLSGPRINGMSHDVQYKASVDNLQRVADLAAKHNLRIVIEPIDPLENPTIWLTSVTDGFQIVRAAALPNLKVLYDFYHEQRAAGNLIDKLENNIDLVGLVHIADVPGRHEPGTGEIDYGNIYRKLAALHYDRFIAMEYYPTEDPTASLRKSRLYALQAIQTKANIR
jgi:hydroxypyruvate isomerase